MAERTNTAGNNILSAIEMDAVLSHIRLAKSLARDLNKTPYSDQAHLALSNLDAKFRRVENTFMSNEDIAELHTLIGEANSVSDRMFQDYYRCISAIAKYIPTREQD